MTRRSLIRVPALALVALGITAMAGMAGAARADTLLTLKIHTDAYSLGAIQEQARDRETRIWIGDRRLRRDEGADSSMVLRLDLNKLYMVNHRAKSYNVIDLPVDFAKLYPEGTDKMIEQASAMAKMDVTVTPRDESKKVGDWNARRYDVVLINAMGMKVETTMWMSKDVGIELATINKMAITLASLQPGSMDWMKKINELPGFPVLKEATVTALDTPIKSVEQLVGVEKKEAPAGLYEPPAGYTEKPFDPQEASGVR